MTLDEIIESLKSTLAKVGTIEVMALLIAAAPPIAWPVINQVVTFIVSKVINLFLDKTELGAFMLRIKILTDAQAADYRKAQEKLSEASNDIERQLAEDEVIRAARDLIKFNH